MLGSGRRVRALVVHADALLGALPAFEVASPWWADVEPVAAELDRRLGARTAVLRMVATTGTAPRGGEVTYLAEALTPPTAPPEWDGAPDPAVLAPHGRRTAWAEPGGPARLLAWAAGVLRGLGRPVDGAPVQVKTWNLSCLFRLPTAAGPVWLKGTPPFLAPDALAAGYVAGHDPGLVPEVLATTPDGGCTLMAGVPGTDCWEADAATVREVLERHVGVQVALAGHDLPGLPDTLVHGDFHPGNWRSDGTDRTVLDWSDAHRGHPANDLLRLSAWLPGPLARAADDRWVAAWRAAVPGSDPGRAAELLRPLQHLEAALTYQSFLDGVEPDERPYHEGDPVAQVRLALAA